MTKNSLFNTGWAIDREHVTPLKDVPLISHTHKKTQTQQKINLLFYLSKMQRSN